MLEQLMGVEHTVKQRSKLLFRFILGVICATGSNSYASIRLKMPIACIANMENGGHAFMNGPPSTNLLRLSVDNRPIFLAHPYIDWLQRAPRIATDSAYPTIMATSTGSDEGGLYSPEVSAAVSSGQLQGIVRGKLDLCVRSNFNASLQNSDCTEQTLNWGVSPGEALDRPFQVRGMDVTLEISTNAITIKSYDGILPSDSTRQALALSCVHPMFVPFLQGFEQKSSLGLTAGNQKQQATQKIFPDYQSPLVVDVDGDGQLALTDPYDPEYQVMFDADGTGKPVVTGWVKGADGLLTLDVNGNGKIDSGRELFGEFSHPAHDQQRNGWFRKFVNGFEALGQYDSNSDQRIDASDPVFTKLRVWVDANTNGQSESNELKSLAELQIASIALKYRRLADKGKPFPVQSGNELRFEGTAITLDGERRRIIDVWFQYKPQRQK